MSRATLAVAPAATGNDCTISALQELQSVQSAVPDGFITVDEQATIRGLNEAAAKLFQFTAEELIGQPVEKLIPLRYQSGLPGYLHYFVNADGDRIAGRGREVVALRRDGSEFAADLAVNEVQVGAERIFVALVRDLSYQKQQAAVLAQAQQALIESERLASLGRIVASVAHEVNTPLGIALTAASHLHDRLRRAEASGTGDEDDLSAARLINANVSRAADLVRGFKQMASDQASGVSRRINLKVYLEDVISNLKPLLKSGRHQLSLQGDDEILLDTEPGCLSQILTNLVENSVRHGFADRHAGHIEISIRNHRDQVHILYTDNGIGISESLRPVLFESFVSSDTSANSSGLGLHISRNLAQGPLAGSLEYLPHSKSALAVGVTGASFLLTLPLTPGKSHVQTQRKSAQ